MSEGPNTPTAVAEARLDEARRVADAYSSLLATKTAHYESALRRGQPEAAHYLAEQQRCSAQLRAARRQLATAGEDLDDLLMASAS